MDILSHLKPTFSSVVMKSGKKSSEYANANIFCRQLLKGLIKMAKREKDDINAHLRLFIIIFIISFLFFEIFNYYYHTMLIFMIRGSNNVQVAKHTKT